MSFPAFFLLLRRRRKRRTYFRISEEHKHSGTNQRSAIRPRMYNKKSKNKEQKKSPQITGPEIEKAVLLLLKFSWQAQIQGLSRRYPAMYYEKERHLLIQDTRNIVHRTMTPQSPSKEAPWDLTHQLPCHIFLNLINGL